ncbi:hypothetical protein GGQ73_002305 [Rhizobium skierniewicense]|uniref:Uncharacterized protein n=1 Tax=Rhizobium skierniewicense TaxID=984260 RepID=A0A7W6CAQ4_9HYPH|nr:hypothetical protein [Rhizobium skierniewicense]
MCYRPDFWQLRHCTSLKMRTVLKQSFYLSSLSHRAPVDVKCALIILPFFYKPAINGVGSSRTMTVALWMWLIRYAEGVP